MYFVNHLFWVIKIWLWNKSHSIKPWIFYIPILVLVYFYYVFRKISNILMPITVYMHHMILYQYNSIIFLFYKISSFLAHKKHQKLPVWHLYNWIFLIYNCDDNQFKYMYLLCRWQAHKRKMVKYLKPFYADK